ncbi:MAG: UbiA prenyltransferase family protein [Fibrobacteres bacterium]|nr:UbiA prenyltransferase family protein [Fibrobacterota bacterium]
MTLTKSSLLHLRLPFSYFLVPIFLLALFSVETVSIVNSVIVFFVLHFLVYTASNGFNTYYDRDEGSIGTLRTPPQVTPDLLWLTLLLDAIAVLIAFTVSWQFALGCFIYGMASKVYSIPSIRIKKYPWLGWIYTGAGQGTFTFLMVAQAVSGCELSVLITTKIMLPALAAGLFVLGMFPITQVYQHEEDRKRGDTTISLLLGVKYTFVIAAVFMTLSISIYFYFFWKYYNIQSALLFTVINLPAALYTGLWFGKVLTGSVKADYSHTMRVCTIASTGIVIFALVECIL